MVCKINGGTPSMGNVQYGWQQQTKMWEQFEYMNRMQSMWKVPYKPMSLPNITDFKGIQEDEETVKKFREIQQAQLEKMEKALEEKKKIMEEERDSIKQSHSMREVINENKHIRESMAKIEKEIRSEEISHLSDYELLIIYRSSDDNELKELIKGELKARQSEYFNKYYIAE